MSGSIERNAAELAKVAHSHLQKVLSNPTERRQISDLTAIPVPTLKDYFSGRTTPPIDRFLLIAMAAKKPPEDFFRPQHATMRLAFEEPDEAFQAGEPLNTAPPASERIPIIEAATAEVGKDHFVHTIREIDSFYFPKSFLKKLGVGAIHKIDALRAPNEDMTPTIEKSALIMVDNMQKDLPPVDADSGVYVLFSNDGLCVKRLCRLESGLLILNDNMSVPPEFQPNDEISARILGKAIWWDNRL